MPQDTKTGADAGQGESGERRRDHDGSYRRLFSEPRMIRDLLRGYVPAPWVRDLDFTTLERWAEARVGPRLRRRSSDVVWRLRLRRAGNESPWLYVFLLLEFQSRVDPYMALRLHVYLGLLYQDLLRSRDRSETGDAAGSLRRLPPVLPLVLYNGNRLWRAPRDVADLIEAVPDLDEYCPRLRYLLLEEARLAEQEDNLASVLFGLERCQNAEEIERRVGQLVSLLPASRDVSLREAFKDFLNESLLPARFPRAEIPEFHNLEEMRSMLKETVEGWWRDAETKGLEKGREEGRSEGRQEGRVFLLLRQLERRFGPLNEDLRRRVEAADGGRLLQWGDRVLDARSLAEVFDEPS